MDRNRVLIIDDDRNICQILKEYFEFEDFEVEVAYTGKEGLNKIKNYNPDVIILDIMLSAKTEDTDRITGLELGADDYVTKPFSPKEVVVRAKTILRRTRVKDTSKKLEYPDLEINKVHRTVKVCNKEISLTPKEFDLLWTLASNNRRVFAREILLKEVWGYEYFGDIRTVDTHIKSLRNKLGDKISSYIKTVWGVGYKFEVLINE